MNSAVDTTAPKQRAIRGVNDGINRQCRDIGAMGGEFGRLKVHGRITRLTADYADVDGWENT